MARWKSGNWKGPGARDYFPRMPCISEEEERQRWEEAFNKKWEQPQDGNGSYLERLERMMRKKNGAES